MPTTIATYYIVELTDWNESISFYNEEMEEFKLKLEEVVRRNSITDIAEKVELHQAMLNHASEKLYNLQVLIEQQKKQLKTDGTPVDNKAIKLETEKQQTELRRRMQEAEKEYIDAKFECYNFLSRVLKK